MSIINNYDWNEVRHSLQSQGHYTLRNLVSSDLCTKLINLYDDPTHFRKVISMARYQFGSGEYKYFQYPLPETIVELREGLYHALQPIAQLWANQVKTNQFYPNTHPEFLDICRKNGQARPTPLLLKYEKGDFNTLHQDLYGEVYFPFQVIVMLNQRNDDYQGGELVLTEQTPRAQSKAIVLTPELGDAVIITTQYRPEKGSKGYYRKSIKHGVSEVIDGNRHTLGIIFHDAA